MLKPPLIFNKGKIKIRKGKLNRIFPRKTKIAAIIIGRIIINDLAKRMLKITGNPPDLIQEDPPEGSVNRRCPDISFLRSLGFVPEVSLNEGLNQTKAYYKPLFNGKDKKLINKELAKHGMIYKDNDELKSKPGIHKFFSR